MDTLADFCTSKKIFADTIPVTVTICTFQYGVLALHPCSARVPTYSVPPLVFPCCSSTATVPVRFLPLPQSMDSICSWRCCLSPSFLALKRQTDAPFPAAASWCLFPTIKKRCKLFDDTSIDNLPLCCHFDQSLLNSPGLSNSTHFRNLHQPPRLSVAFTSKASTLSGINSTPSPTSPILSSHTLFPFAWHGEPKGRKAR